MSILKSLCPSAPGSAGASLPSMQAALEEQKALVAQAQQEAAAAQQAKIDAQTAPGVTVAQQVAIDNGVSEDTLVRQQISGEILSAVEDAKAQLKELKEKATKEEKKALEIIEGIAILLPLFVAMFIMGE